MIRTAFALSFALIVSIGARAQVAAINGTVVDANTQQPIEMAAVKLLKGSREQLAAYAMTDSKGAFSVAIAANTDSLVIAVSSLGYRTHKQAVVPGEQKNIQLAPEAINLREVVVRPGRVWGRQDTINYDVSRFLDNNDESIKDVISKLPGVDVDDNGSISYNGKAISKFYVEGMDLVGGRYNQISKNLQAKSVETVQILDNHQPIKMLKDKLKTEDVAINLKLQPNFRDKWMVYLGGGGGLSSGPLADDFLWTGDLNAMQLSRGSQSAYMYKGNNTGNNVATDLLMLINQASHLTKEPAVASFVSQPSLDAPLKTERLLFNNMHTASANRLYRISESTQLRINAGYTHDDRRQERGSHIIYYQPDSIQIDEASLTRVRSDKANLDISLEENNEQRYLSNKFTVSGEIAKGTSDYHSDHPFRQLIRTNATNINNDLRSLKSTGKYTLEIRSLLRFLHAPSQLAVHDDRQKLNLNHFYTDNALSVLKKKNSLTQQYAVGFNMQTSNIANGYSIYLYPNWQWQFDQFRASLTTPATLTQFAGTGFSRPAINPALSLEYKLNYAWRVRLYGSFNESYGSVTDFYDQPYRINYRQTIVNNGTLTVHRRQLYSIYAEYKNTINEFFASLSVNHQRGWSNKITETSFQDEQITTTYHNRHTRSTGWTLSGTLSKGIYDWRIKASVNYQLSQYKSEQLSNGEPLPYEARHIKIDPKVNWNPWNPLEVVYEGSVRYGGTTVGQLTKLDPLLNIVQKLNLYYNFTFIELGFAADHYYNDVSSQKGVNAFLVDASLRWKSGRWQISVSANNLLNKQQYGYTQYSTLQSYTSWINIRGREFWTSVRYRF